MDGRQAQKIEVCFCSLQVIRADYVKATNTNLMVRITGFPAAHLPSESVPIYKALRKHFDRHGISVPALKKSLPSSSGYFEIELTCLYQLRSSPTPPASNLFF